MKSYTITVNGNVYDVTVEEKNEAGAASAPAAAPKAVGQKVKRGEPVVIIEAMKMEIPVVAPEDGTVASIELAVGDACEAGTLLATLN